jgi:hypothetical protein
MLAVEDVGMTVKDLGTSVRFYSALFDTAPLDRAEWRGKDAEYVANMMGSRGSPWTPRSGIPTASISS